MGFMDKAKKMAEQAQTKLDEAQKQFNAGQGAQQPSGPVTEYDKHGRPIPPSEPAPPAAPMGAGTPPAAAASGLARRDGAARRRSASAASARAARSGAGGLGAAARPGSGSARRSRASGTAGARAARRRGRRVRAAEALLRGSAVRLMPRFVPSSESMDEIRGLFTAMVTPFRADGSVNDEAGVALARHLLEQGSHGLVVCGTTGEASTMTDEEHVGFVRTIASELGDEAPIFAGAGSNDTRHATHLTEAVVEAGAQAVLSVTPYYNKPNRRGLLAALRRGRPRRRRPAR